MEATAVRLQKKFTQHQIVIVQASRMSDGVFACYDNFVKSDSYGVPSFCKDEPTAAQHLCALLENFGQRVGLNYRSISLAGFSKGYYLLFLLIVYDEVCLLKN